MTTLNLQEDSVVMDRLAEMTTPTLVLAGSDDRPEYTGAGEYLERKMPDARLVVVDGGGHSMHEDSHAAEVADAHRRVRRRPAGLSGTDLSPAGAERDGSRANRCRAHRCRAGRESSRTGGRAGSRWVNPTRRR